MRISSPLTAVHTALMLALQKDLADEPRETIDHEARKVLELAAGGKRIPMCELPRKTVRVRPDECNVRLTMFAQTWGSTALGYGGIGGAAICEAYTVVVATRAEACVYFGDNELAYRVALAGLAGPSLAQLANWEQDLRQRQLAGRRDALERYGAVAA